MPKRSPGATAQLPEEDATGVNWVRVGVTNRWAMFDMLVATPTVAVAPLVVRLAPGRISAAALIKASGGTNHSGKVSSMAPSASNTDNARVWFDDAGVDAHPHDWGMSQIAARVLAAITSSSQ